MDYQNERNVAHNGMKGHVPVINPTSQRLPLMWMIRQIYESLIRKVCRDSHCQHAPVIDTLQLLDLCRDEGDYARESSHESAGSRLVTIQIQSALFDAVRKILQALPVERRSLERMPISCSAECCKNKAYCNRVK